MHPIPGASGSPSMQEALMKILQPSRTFPALLIATALAGAVACVACVGCKGEASTDAAANAEVAAEGEATAGAEASIGADALIEEHEHGSVAWNIAPDGNMKAAVSGPDGKLIRENVAATLEWKAGAETKTVPLTLDAKTGLLVGAGAKLEADLTEIAYKLTVDSKPWTGTLHLPAGGTAELVAGAKAAIDINIPEGKLGPHGGVIQVVGKDRLEIVADEVSGEVRVYLLDADFNAIAMGDRTITLGVTAVADAPQIVVLTAAEGGAYCKGKWGIDVDPLKLTVMVKSGASVAAALVGHRPGAKISVKANAPRVKVRVKTGWAAHVEAPDIDVPDVDVHGKAGIKGNAEAKAKAAAKASVKAHAPSVSVKVKAPKIEAPKVSAKGKVSAGVKFP